MEDYSKDTAIKLPPISFSAPELGSCEPIKSELLRISVSSSELLRERTLDRMNKDIAEQEAEEVLKTKYAIERKRSFEKKQKKEPYTNRTSTKAKETEQDDIYDVPEGIEGKTRKSYMKSVEEEEEESTERRRGHRYVRRSSKDKFMQSDSSFEEFSTRIEDYEYYEGSDYEGDYDYGDDEYEGSSDLEMKYDFEKSRISRYYRDELPEEEETFHRNMTMLPKPTAPPLPVSKEPSPPPSPVIVPQPISPVNIPEATSPVNIPQVASSSVVAPPQTTPEVAPQPPLSLFIPPPLSLVIPPPGPPAEKVVDMSPPKREILESYFKELRRSMTPDIQTRKPPEPEFTVRETIVPRTNERDSAADDLHLESKEIPLTPVTPKPILKVSKDDLIEKKPDKKNLISRITMKKSSGSDNRSVVSGASSVDSEKRNKKKVRIEEPFDDDYFDNDGNLVMTGEVAKNRRRMNKQKRDSNEPKDVVINHYSDIVREYGQIGQKPKVRLYLNYEELKAAAEKANPVENIDLNQPVKKAPPPLTTATKTAPPPKKKSFFARFSKEKPEEKAKVPPAEIRAEPSTELPVEQPKDTASDETQEVKTKPSLDVLAPTKFQSVTEFILDFILIIIAIYLYIFKDARLAVPVLVLLIYRKVHDAVSNKIIAKITKFFKKTEKID